MKKLVENFPNQLREAFDIANGAKLSPKNQIQNVIITGLGGSGIGGTIISELVSDNCPVPVTINKDYFLPAFTDSNTLVIISSYSGNTEETLQAMEQAIAKKAQVVCVTSGGKVAELASKNNFDVITIPGGNPPRSCIGYSLVQLIKVLVFKKARAGIIVE
ncbi:MAG TPA: SIS domain-containing protein [Bacteroidia bacterium]|nr:SIS domain-containing protein [Bacteroidia bacterium]